MKIKVITILSVILIVISLITVDARKNEEEIEERRERRRQRQGRRRQRWRDQEQSPPETPVEAFETPLETPAFPPNVQFPPSDQQPQDASNPCASGTICTKSKDCPFITSVGNGISCPLVTRRGRPINGVCCPEAQNFDDAEETPSIRTPIQFPERSRNGPRIPGIFTKLPLITPRDVARAVKAAANFIRNLQNTENILQDRNLFAPKFSKENAQSNFFGNDPQVNELSKTGRLSNQITNELASNFGLNQSSFEEIAPTLNTPIQTAIRSAFPNSVTGTCPEKINCKDWISYKYRTADGSCNNLKNTNWGKTLTPFNRLLKPDYEDSFDKPKITGRGSGQLLPSARKISSTISPHFEENPARDDSEMFTYFLMQWGQFLDHDLTLTATSRSESGSSLKCCGPEFEADASLLHPACFPIDVPSDDPFYSQFGLPKCMSFIRSATAPRINCALGAREQMNQLSAFVDGGNVYGSSKPSSDGLRSFSGGQLKSSNVDGNEFLPLSGSTCSVRSCSFRAGDGRANIQPNLVAMHAIFLREHNNIARELSRLNPTWSDEALFQETRRIIIAILQQITYSEFLPIILGKKIINLFDLDVKRLGFSASYDQNLDPGIINSFSSAAYRLHTLIPKTISFADSVGNVKSVSDISDNYMFPRVYSESGTFGNLVNGMASSASSKFDQRHTDQITNHMFRSASASFGVDLLALNIQRGRDHGLPSYNRWRQICNLRTFNTFDAMKKVMRPGTVETMQSLYFDPEDVDLYVGGNSEEPLRGSLIGPTFACILGEQFRRIKNGDRFWYENGPSNVHSFTDAQLASIKNVTLSRIICDATPNVQSMQPFAFIQANDDWNARTDCRDKNAIPAFDLNPWFNEPVVN